MEETWRSCSKILQTGQRCDIVNFVAASRLAHGHIPFVAGKGDSGAMKVKGGGLNLERIFSYVTIMFGNRFIEV